MPTVLPIFIVIIIFCLLIGLFFWLLLKVVRSASVAWYQGKRAVEEGRDKK
ncbi:MAG: hypothetical protein V4655_06340 [Bdellovibrionota bacterium]